MIDPLSRLAILYGTDKFCSHDYTPHYHSLLADRRDQQIHMLEIGVGGYGDGDRGGESLAVWRDYFSQGQITGIDIHPKLMDLGSRVKILQGSQVDADFLEKLNEDRGPFEIILDDGSHENEHVVETFKILFPTLSGGGIYIVEDVQTAFFPGRGGSITLDEPNSVGFFANKMLDLSKGEAGDVISIERFHNIIALHKATDKGSTSSYKNDRRLANHSGPEVPVVKASKASKTYLLNKAIAKAENSGLLVIDGWPDDTKLLHELFVQIDHREIALYFPDAPIHDFSSKVLSIAAYPDGLVLELGDNTYPSNFNFDQKHPRVAAALDVMEEVLRDPEASPNGLLQYANLLQQRSGRKAAYGILDRLAAQGCVEKRYFQFAVARAKHGKHWQDLVTLSEEALRHFPNNAGFLVELADGYCRTDRFDDALKMLRQAYEDEPQRRGVVVALAQLEQQAGKLDIAVRLLDRAINMFPKADRPTRLQELAALAMQANRPANAIRAYQRWLILDPGNEIATKGLAELQQTPLQT